MSTTRHLINRQRRLAAVSAAAQERTADPAPARARTSRPAAVTAEPARPAGARRPLPVAVTLLAVLTVLLGGFAAVAASRASALHGSVAAHNTALTDTARTSEIKGTIAEAVNAVFSYDYADTARTDAAAKRLLTGKAVQQYAAMLAQVRAQAPAQKLVLTTTVTDTGVETIDGDRAHVLVFADQRNTSTAKAGAGSTYAAAMFAVDAVHQDGTWKIAAIDTFG
jgi:Mce-associated membrane protein